MAPIAQRVSVMKTRAATKAKTVRSARLNTRLPSRAHARIESAAELSGATINQFVIQAALEKADRLLDRERETVLSERDAKRFLELLDRPPALNARLARSLAAYQEATRGHPDRPFEWPARPRGV